jgi:spore maturation protein CgeB
MSRAVPLSGRAAATFSSTAQNAVKPSAGGVNRYLTNLRLRTSTFHTISQDARGGSTDRTRSENLAVSTADLRDDRDYELIRDVHSVPSTRTKVSDSHPFCLDCKRSQGQR